jgi:serine/threonine-protein kinase
LLCDRGATGLIAVPVCDSSEAWGTLFVEAPVDDVVRCDALADQLAAWFAGQRDSDAQDESRQGLPSDVPRRIGRYDVVRRIGSGGMATVYLGKTEVAGGERLVAHKILHSHLHHAGGGEQFSEEARLTASIRHANVVQVLDYGEHGSRPFLVMEYVEGTNLAALARRAIQDASRSTIPIPIVGRILSDVASGLHAAHELRDEAGLPMNVVHRDVSLQNVMAGVDGVTRITDFGIAKTRALLEVTRHGWLSGKLRYMSPEQIAGEQVDRRADIWALGVVAWELIAGRRLFGRDADEEVVRRIRAGELRALGRGSGSDLPSELVEVVGRALRRDPGERFATALELRSAVVDAWQTAGGIADSEDVARYVKWACSSHEPLSVSTRALSPDPASAAPATVRQRR